MAEQADTLIWYALQLADNVQQDRNVFSDGEKHCTDWVVNSPCQVALGIFVGYAAQSSAA